MSWEAYYTAGVIVLLVAALASGRIGADVVFLSALAALLVAGVLEPAEAVAGFANPAPITVGLLFVAAEGLRETGGMLSATRFLLGRPGSESAALTRLLLPAAPLSAFVNNTPIVAMFLPALAGWARRNRLSPSRLYMPLCFAVTLGGMCTLIGTSTNIVVNELLIEHAADKGSGLRPMGMFTLAAVGAPVAAAGIAFVILIGRHLLPDREEGTPETTDPRQYTVWMKLRPDSPLAGRTIEQAGLRHLRGLFLTAIERDGETLFAVGPDVVLHADDKLHFVGDVESVVDLQQFPGLAPETEQIHKLAPPRYRRRLTEAVVSPSSPLVGKSVREGEFRGRYNAVIIAVHRAGERVPGKIGDIVLRPGDTLLLEAPAGFARRHRNSSAFYLVSELPDAPTPRWGLAWLAIALFAGFVVAVTAGALDIMTAALCCGVLMILTRCCTGTQARQAVDWQVLIVIGSAFGIARAMEQTQLASTIAGGVLGRFADLGIYGALGGVFLVTALLTNIMTNNAAAALIFPVALALARDQGFDCMPFVVVVAIAASSAFMTPVGYQTNLMIAGPGGYTWGDFVRLGGPLTVIAGVTCVALAPTLYGGN
jgi:di/tricarboxylate transporter